MDARFFNPPPARKKGQKGRSRVVGPRQLTPKTRAVRKATKWTRMAVPGWRAADGSTDRDVGVATGTALWNSHGMTVPVRWAEPLKVPCAQRMEVCLAWALDWR
jgi:hypothetical protein